MWITVARRLVFFLALLGMGALTVTCFHFTHNTQWVRSAGGIPSPAWIAFGTFAWGTDSLVYVLAVWLAARSRVWSTWSGRVRAAAYLFAFTYGRMLFSATQDWLTGPHDPDGPVAFRWPGAQLEDFARPSLDLLTLLMLVWLLVPVFTLTRSRLTDEGHSPNVRGTFSIASILGWTTVAALILLWIRFLTWKGIAPQTAYSFLTPTQALTEYAVEYLPNLLIVATSVLLLAWGWSGRWWWPFVTMPGALLIASLGHTLLYAILKWNTGDSNSSSVLAGSGLEHWSFLAGQICLVCIAFGMARVAGVRFHRSPLANNQSAPPTEPKSFSSRILPAHISK
jgi:hypothetical protein